jgi:hypothetical protein
LNSLAIGKYQKRAINIVVVASVLLTAVLVGIADTRNDEAIQLTDYVSAFYLAGKIVNQNSATLLYPQPLDASLRGAPFDVLGHKYLPATNAGNFFLFMYPPVVALMFTPLAYLAERLSLVVWQLISVLYLFGAAAIFKRFAHSSAPLWLLAASAYTLLCVMHNLVIGQIVILLGVLPITFGWLLWQREKDFLCGLAFAIAVLKPQFLVPILVLPVALLVGAWIRKDLLLIRSGVKMLAGLILGILFIFLVQTILTGPACLSGWLRCLGLVNRVMNGGTVTPWANHLFLSIPGLLGTALTDPSWQRLVPFLQGGIMIAATAFLGLTDYRIWQSRFTADEKRQLSLVCLFSLLPLMAVYLRDYDYALVVPAMWVVFFAMDRRSKIFPCAFQAIVATMIALNLQMILFVVLKGAAYSLVPWFTALALSIIGLRLCGQVSFRLWKEG